MFATNLEPQPESSRFAFNYYSFLNLSAKLLYLNNMASVLTPMKATEMAH